MSEARVPMPMSSSRCSVNWANQVASCSTTRRTTSRRESKSVRVQSMGTRVVPLIRKDEFAIECPSVGEISKILIAHNNKGSAPGWFLDRILVEDLDDRRIYEFPCYKWLATDEGDRQISRFLLPKDSLHGDKQATGGKSSRVLASVEDSMCLSLSLSTSSTYRGW